MLTIILFFFSQQGWANQPSEKVVSLDLCTDWMLLKYGSQSLSVTFSPLLYRYKQDWVADGLAVHDGSLEQILDINPELIISGEFNATLLIKRLRQLGKTVEIMPLPLSLQDIIDYTKKFKMLLPTRQQLNKLPAIKRFKANGKKLLLLGANGIGTGKATLENDIIEKSGWQNYLQLDGFASLDLEKIVMNPPDAVLWTKPVSSSLANLFARHRVLRTIVNLQGNNLDDAWRWQCPGPWSFELLTELATWQKH